MPNKKNNEFSELRELAKNAVNNKAVSVSSEIDAIHNDLVRSVENSKLHESYFKEYFLDYFKSGTNEKNLSLDLKWSELAGGMFREVDIIDDKGGTLYTVPPLYAHPTTSGQPIENIDFQNMALEYSMRSNRLGVEGTKYLGKALSGLDKQVVSDSQKEVAQRWDNIFNKYDEKNKKQENNNNTVHISGMLDDLLEYD